SGGFVARYPARRNLLRLSLHDALPILVRARGRVSLYEGRGDYQMVLDAVEPAGDGALRQAFEALQARLQAEGLFAAERQRPLPSRPTRIGVLSSPSGGAVRHISSACGPRTRPGSASSPRPAARRCVTASACSAGARPSLNW